MVLLPSFFVLIQTLKIKISNYLYILYIYFKRAALKVTPPILFWWSMMSEADVSGMAVEAEPSHKYSLKCCCCVTQQQRGSLTKWHLTYMHLWNKEVSLNSFTHRKWQLLTLINAFWIYLEIKQWMWAQWGSGWWVSEVATETVSHFCLCRHLCVWHAGSCSLLMKMHS